MQCSILPKNSWVVAKLMYYMLHKEICVFYLCIKSASVMYSRIVLVRFKSVLATFKRVLSF